MTISCEKLVPVTFGLEEVKDFLWSERDENKLFFNHLCNVAQNYPSVFLAYSASTIAMVKASELAVSLSNIGVNVFMSEVPVPLCAFSLAMSLRNSPLGLYLSMDNSNKQLKLTAINSYGGYFAHDDILDKEPVMQKKKCGVIGQTEMLKSYVTNLKKLSDEDIEKGEYFSKLDNPFAMLSQLLSKQSKPKIILERNITGYSAEISDDGQILTIYDKNGEKLSAETIASNILNYLIKERFASGTVIGPKPLPKQEINEDNYIEAKSISELHFKAGFCDLLMAWWSDGTIVHQGSGCFGDALLTAIYFLESMR